MSISHAANTSRPSREAPTMTITPATPSATLPAFPGDSIGAEKPRTSSSSRAASPHTVSSNAAERTRIEIIGVLRMLKQLEIARMGIMAEDNSEDLVKNLNTDDVLRARLTKLRAKLNVLEWRALASKRSLLNLDPLVVERLLDIQRDSASAVGALSVVGATLALSLIYSATRGNMWYPFVSWWMFVVSLATTSGLSFAAAGSSVASAGDLLESELDPGEGGNMARATPHNWAKQKISVLAVAFSLIGVAGGWALLAAGAAGYNLHTELNGGEPNISGGPDLGDHGINLAPRLVTYLIIGIFVFVLIGGYFYRLRPSLHARSFARTLTERYPGDLETV